MRDCWFYLNWMIIIIMQEDVNYLRQQLRKYEELEQEWLEERQQFVRSTNELQQQVIKLKTINSSLIKKAKHKRTSSEQHTIIFNQTNISSIYPMVLLQSSSWTCRNHVRAHLDSVRTLSWVGQYLLSAGDDGLLKLWEKDQPKATIRQHLGPVYSTCTNGQQIFTAGAEGVVRKWQVSDLLSGKGPTDQMQLNNDCIWQLCLNPFSNVLLSSSADGTCKLVHLGQKMKQGRSFSTKNDIPTSIDWLSINKFICGYTNNYKLAVYDIQLGKQSKEYIFTPKEQNSQTNKVIYTERHKLIITAHEDRCLRFFDPNSNKVLKVITGHSDAVTSVCSRPQGFQILSCGHDGSMRIWDLRKYRCVNDISVHMRKYDEGALCLTHKKDESIVAVGGADGHIKTLTPQH